MKKDVLEFNDNPCSEYPENGENFHHSVETIHATYQTLYSCPSPGIAEFVFIRSKQAKRTVPSEPVYDRKSSQVVANLTNKRRERKSDDHLGERCFI